MVRGLPGAQQTLKLPEIPEMPETGLNPVQTACAQNATPLIGPEPCAKWTFHKVAPRNKTQNGAGHLEIDLNTVQSQGFPEVGIQFLDRECATTTIPLPVKYDAISFQDV